MLSQPTGLIVAALYDKPANELIRRYHPDYGLTAFVMPSSHRTTLLCLGREYGLAEAADGALPGEIYSLDLVSRRGWYLSELRRQIACETDSRQRIFMQWELAGWLYDDDAYLSKRIYSYLDPDDRLDTRNHWIWRGKDTGSRPVIGFRNYKNVSVMRVLWTRYRNDEFRLTAEHRPQPDPRLCSSTLSRLCVNPFHSRLYVRTDVAPDPTALFRGRRAEFPFRPTWYAEEARELPNGELGVLCHVCNKPLSDATQREFLSGKTRGRGYCPHCHAARNANAGRVTRGYRTDYDPHTALTGYIQKHDALNTPFPDRHRASDDIDWDEFTAEVVAIDKAKRGEAQPALDAGQDDGSPFDSETTGVVD